MRSELGGAAAQLALVSDRAEQERAGSVLDLMESILSGAKTPWDIPLIRVAAKKGAYWCVDNRRLFTYKHLQLGKIPVQVFSWKENREFELKYRNGLPFRRQTANGLRLAVWRRELDQKETSFRSPCSQLQELLPIKGQPAKKKRKKGLSASKRKLKAAKASQDEKLTNLLPVVEFVTSAMVSFFSLGFMVALVTAGATRMDRSEEVQVDNSYEAVCPGGMGRCCTSKCSGALEKCLL
eukprot:g5215.t1